MNEQEKQELQELFIAICGYLPYGIKATYIDKTLVYSDVRSYNLDNASYIVSEIVHIRPYLRPMSSMTDEEREEYGQLRQVIWDKLKDWKCADLINWLNKHHFDYQGLIEKGLAIEAPKDMYV